MESLDKIVGRMESPLAFASGDSYNRISLIKNLGTVMTSLLRQLEEGIRRDFDQSPRQNELDRLLTMLLALFDGYETLTPEIKKDRLARAKGHLSELKSILHDAATTAGNRGQTPAPQAERSGPDLLSRSIQFIQGVGPRIASLLARKNLSTIEELLYFLPRRYEDRRTISRIAETAPGIRQTIVGRVIRADSRFYGRRRVFEAMVDDGSGILKAKWFKGREAFLRGAFKPEARVILTGEVTGFPFEKEIIHPDFEILNDQEDQLLHFKRIVPIYSETEGLPQKTIRRILWKVVRDFAHLVQSPIPGEICRKRNLLEIGEAIRQVHFPGNDQPLDLYQEMRSEAHRRLIYDEFFFFQLGMALRKQGGVLEQGISFLTDGEMVRKFYRLLPFALTAAQRRVITEIELDMASPSSMNRLLQGDVGSGKTVVSMAALITACENGHQAAIMAPTEILAEQHYRNFRVWAENLGLRTALLTGGLKTAERGELQGRIQNGEIDLVVGTHALIQEGVLFRDLGLIVIDEQHRFGVVQRATLRQKGQIPDVLVMTATPIPRTLAMTLYGDLDISVIDEMPPGKIPVRTKVFSESQRTRVYEIIRREAKKGNQIFIVYPLVEASENLDLKDATRMAEHLRKEIFPECRVGLVHGRMKGKEKEQVMNDFGNKMIDILVSTTVIEVGIDIPEASLMVIEHAERFGLSQLHQLRGRVGRSDIPSFCILLTQKTGSEDARKRLRIMEQTSDGFRIAEEDLAIRGPGEFMGTRQSGLPDFRIASVVRDGRILGEARADAFALVEDDPRLENQDHPALREALLRRWRGRLEMAKTG
ncbi:MAG: DNA helicase RecG [Syntrophobacterales bacterium CG_4_8_14_3_um_filter_58_8]|nr:MAG: DNA helicase RecG [Syntrophobacterales bacterium CG_4_8_14_3_um_filter_58_8]